MLSFESRAMEIDRSVQRVQQPVEQDFTNSQGWNSQANVWSHRTEETDPEEGISGRLVVAPPNAWRTEESLPSPPPSPATPSTLSPI